MVIGLIFNGAAKSLILILLCCSLNASSVGGRLEEWKHARIPMRWKPFLATATTVLSSFPLLPCIVKLPALLPVFMAFMYKVSLLTWKPVVLEDGLGLHIVTRFTSLCLIETCSCEQSFHFPIHYGMVGICITPSIKDCVYHHQWTFSPRGPKC